MSAHQSGSKRHPERKAYVSDGGYFVYFSHRDEFGTNRRNPATPELARLALRGIDVFIDSHPDEARWENAHIEEDIDADKVVIGFRMSDLRLLEEGLKRGTELPGSEITFTERSLVYAASRDLILLVQDLAQEDLLPHQ